MDEKEKRRDCRQNFQYPPETCTVCYDCPEKVLCIEESKESGVMDMEDGYVKCKIEPKNMEELVDIGQFLRELKQKDSVAVDFDGVLVKFDEWNGSDHVGEYYTENKPKENLRRLIDNGFRVIIYTCRSELEPVEEFLYEYGIPYHHINENPYQPETISDCKIFAKWYIDDRNPNHKGLTDAVDVILESGKNE